MGTYLICNCEPVFLPWFMTVAHRKVSWFWTNPYAIFKPCHWALQPVYSLKGVQLRTVRYLSGPWHNQFPFGPVKSIYMVSAVQPCVAQIHSKLRVKVGQQLMLRWELIERIFSQPENMVSTIQYVRGDPAKSSVIQVSRCNGQTPVAFSSCSGSNLPSSQKGLFWRGCLVSSRNATPKIPMVDHCPMVSLYFGGSSPFSDKPSCWMDISDIYDRLVMDVMDIPSILADVQPSKTLSLAVLGLIRSKSRHLHGYSWLSLGCFLVVCRAGVKLPRWPQWFLTQQRRAKWWIQAAVPMPITQLLGVLWTY